MTSRGADLLPGLCCRSSLFRALATLSSLTVPLWNNDARAAGFALREYSFEGASNAFAGASAQSDSASGLAYNAASSAGVNDWDAQVTLNAIYPTSDAIYSLATTSVGTPTGGSSTPGDFILDAYEPGLAVRKRLDEHWTAGLTVTVPWGLGSRYRDTWAGRYYAIETKLATVNANPSLAYAISDRFSVAAGLQVEYAQGALSNAIDFGTIGLVNQVAGAAPGAQDGIVEFKATDWAFGYNLGLLWHPVDDLSIGLSYRSALQHELKGDVNFTLDSGGMGAALSGATGAFVNTRGRTSLNLPAITALGLNWHVTPDVSLLAEIDYTQWSAFKELRVQFSNPFQPDSFQTYDWQDTWLVSGGIRYDVAPGWIVRTGVAIDQTPSRNATRDPRIPDATRTWLAFGITHDLTPNTSLEIGYARLAFPKEPITLSASTPGNELRGNLDGVTDADVDMISFQITMH